nr:hypothetical protein [Rhodococcus sp. USK10]
MARQRVAGHVEDFSFLNANVRRGQIHQALKHLFGHRRFGNPVFGHAPGAHAMLVQADDVCGTVEGVEVVAFVLAHGYPRAGCCGHPSCQPEVVDMKMRGDDSCDVTDT